NSGDAYADWLVIRSENKWAEMEAKKEEALAETRRKAKEANGKGDLQNLVEDAGGEEPRTFTCRLDHVSGAAFSTETFTLTLGSLQAIIEADGRTYKGGLDGTYMPRFHQDRVRFTGYPFGWLLVQRQMLSGGSGYVKIQEANGRDFFNQSARCG